MERNGSDENELHRINVHFAWIPSFLDMFSREGEV
jgi:hypothetical protein